MTRLGNLRQGINCFTIFFYSHQVRWSRQVAVPDVMTNGLVMPDALTGSGIQGQQAVGKKVGPMAIAAVKVKSCRACRYVHDPTRLIYRHAGPVVGTTHKLVSSRVFPALVAVLPGLRNGMKNPLLLAAANVKGADVAGSGRQSFGVERSHNDEVFVNGARRMIAVVESFYITAQALGEVNLTALTKAIDGLTGIGIQGVEVFIGTEKQAAVIAFFPESQSSGEAALVGTLKGVEFPFTLSGSSIQGKNFEAGRNAIQDTMCNERVCLDIIIATALLARLVSPGYFQLLHIVLVNLVKR